MCQCRLFYEEYITLLQPFRVSSKCSSCSKPIETGYVCPICKADCCQICYNAFIDYTESRVFNVDQWLNKKGIQYIDSHHELFKRPWILHTDFLAYIYLQYGYRIDELENYLNGVILYNGDMYRLLKE